MCVCVYKVNINMHTCTYIHQVRYFFLILNRHARLTLSAFDVLKTTENSQFLYLCKRNSAVKIVRALNGQASHRILKFGSPVMLNLAGLQGGKDCLQFLHLATRSYYILRFHVASLPLFSFSRPQVCLEASTREEADVVGR